LFAYDCRTPAKDEAASILADGVLAWTTDKIIVGAVLDDNGRPMCCEMWPGNTTDVTVLIPEI
jgi:hypothetical protein